MLVWTLSVKEEALPIGQEAVHGHALTSLPPNSCRRYLLTQLLLYLHCLVVGFKTETSLLDISTHCLLVPDTWWERSVEFLNSAAMSVPHLDWGKLTRRHKGGSGYWKAVPFVWKPKRESEKLVKRIEPGRLECWCGVDLRCLAKVLLVLGDTKKTLKVTGRADLNTFCLFEEGNSGSNSEDEYKINLLWRRQVW